MAEAKVEVEMGAAMGAGAKVAGWEEAVRAVATVEVVRVEARAGAVTAAATVVGEMGGEMGAVAKVVD